ncbi:hypothetical protein BKI52_28770 [marine bacterium AO1-C]|nr:hypothetical protein BKI52_28770 [marine bacterium AO1-C]
MQNYNIPKMEIKLIDTEQLLEYGSEDTFTQPVFFFKGNITHLTIAKMKNMIDKKVKQNHQLHHKVKGIFLELAQNVMSYSVEYNDLDGEERVGLLVLDETEDAFIIITRNSILQEQVDTLSKQFQKINSLDEEALFALKAQITKENLTKKTKRAGIGLVQVAILSKHEILTQLQVIDKQLAYLTIAVRVSK